MGIKDNRCSFLGYSLYLEKFGYINIPINKVSRDLIKISVIDKLVKKETIKGNQAVNLSFIRKPIRAKNRRENIKIIIFFKDIFIKLGNLKVNFGIVLIFVGLK